MGFRETGKTETIKKKITERFCDVCSKTIDKYPIIEVEVSYVQYRYDGDQPAIYDICSPDCLLKLAEQLK